MPATGSTQRKRGRGEEGSKRSRRFEDDGDDDEFAEPGVGTASTQTKSSKSKSKKKGGGGDDQDGAEAFNHGNTEVLAHDMARFAILHEWKRKPMRRDEAGRTVLGRHARHFPTVFSQSNVLLGQVFGFEMIEVRQRGQHAGQIAMQVKEAQIEAAKRARRAQIEGEEVEEQEESKKKSSNTTRSYMLRSKLKPEWISKACQIVERIIPEDEQRQRSNTVNFDPDIAWARDDASLLDWRRGDELGQQGILGVILGLILANGRVMDDKQLRAILKRMNVTSSWTPPHTPASHHPPPTLDTLLLTFQRQHYLERDKSQLISTMNNNTQASQAATSTQRRRGVATQNVGKDSEGGDIATEWKWGARSEIEFGEVAIARMMADIYVEAQNLESTTTTSSNTSMNRNRSSLGRNGESVLEQLLMDIRHSATSDLQDANDLTLSRK